MGFFDRSKKSKKPASPAQSLSSSSPKPDNRKPSQPPPQTQPQQQSHPSQGPPNWLEAPSGSFQSVGYHVAPSQHGWAASSQAGSPPPPYQYHHGPYAQPIVVNQHYYLSPPPSNSSAICPSQVYQQLRGRPSLNKLKLGSAVNLVSDAIPAVPQLFDDQLPRWHGYGTQLINQSAALYDQIYSRFNDVMTLIDHNKLSGHEGALFTYQPPQAAPPPEESRSRTPKLATAKKSSRKERDAPKGQTTAVASTIISGGYFAKVHLYANSRLPLDLPPLRLYIPTYPLLCLAAQYSESVYDKPRGAETHTHVDADWRIGSKAMVIKSVPMDHMNTIVFAIRGTATFMDWAVNLNTAPTSPAGFLDDPGNFCHAGFLSVAKKMIAPVAARLRQLLSENPNRCRYSLMITGHSAGGAVASLLYSHMLSTSPQAQSELNRLTARFKRVHCVTFGTPPISLLPLQKPDRPELKKSLFLSFVNEGDPVARADKAYVKSLLELFTAPEPKKEKSSPPTKPIMCSSGGPKEKKSKSSLKAKASKLSLRPTADRKHSSGSSTSSSSSSSKPVWKLPPSTLSNAGRIVVLRSGDPKAKPRDRKTVEDRLNEGVVAQTTTDEQLRSQVWGDPVCHVMKLYAGRIEILAVGAVTVKGY